MRHNYLFESYPDVVGVSEMALMIGCGRNTAYELLREKKIRAIKVGRSFRVPKVEILCFLGMLDETEEIRKQEGEDNYDG